MGQDFYYKELYYSLNVENLGSYIPISFEIKLTNMLELQECYMNFHYCDNSVSGSYSCVNPGKICFTFLRDLDFKPIVFEDYCLIRLNGTIVVPESVIERISTDYFTLFVNKPE